LKNNIFSFFSRTFYACLERATQKKAQRERERERKKKEKK